MARVHCRTRDQNNRGACAAGHDGPGIARSGARYRFTGHRTVPERVAGRITTKITRSHKIRQMADRLIIDPAYLQTRHDRELFREALEAARAIGHHSALDEWRDRELRPGFLESYADIDNFIANAVITHHHPSGTCRMGNDVNAVVNPDLRLTMLDNLHIVDASVISRLTAGPIHAAVLTIAETFARVGGRRCRSWLNYGLCISAG